MANEIIETIMEDFLNALADSSAAASSESSRLRTPLPSVDIDGFFRLVGSALARQQEIDGAKNKILFTEEYPEVDDNISGEVITYKLVERKPGTFDNKPTGSMMNDTNIRQRKKFFREAQDDPENTGFSIYTYGQWFDNQIEFNIVCKNNKLANARALWFENFMESWAWYFEASGVSMLRYLGRGADSVSTIDNKKRAIRPLTYLVRTEKLTVIRENTLRTVLVTSELD